jgi:hypothetical protein
MTRRGHSGTAVAGVLLAALVSGLLYRYWPSPDRDIRRHLSNLSEALSLSTTEGEAASLIRFAVMREYFAEDVRVSFDDEHILSRDAVIDRVRRWPPPPGGLAVELVDVRVTLSADRSSAAVELTAKVSTSGDAQRGSTLDVRRVHIAMGRRGGDWVIFSAQAVSP